MTTTCTAPNAAAIAEDEAATGRFQRLATITGLSKEPGKYRVDSVAFRTDQFDLIGYTDDLTHACRAAVILLDQALPGERFEARDTDADTRDCG